MAESDGRIALALSPLGRLHVTPGEAGDAPVDEAAARRIEEAFARGSGAGLLQLGAGEVHTALPPILDYFRRFARAFVTRLCGIADIEELRERVSVPTDGDELARLAGAAPPIRGAEYLDAALLEKLWSEMEGAFRAAIAASPGSVQEYLQTQSPVWNLVGRVCFHLAENKRDAERPFAFLATYTTRLSAQARPQHRPLGQALRESSSTGNKGALLSLLLPVHRAAEQSEFLKELVGSGELFQPLAWTPREAYRFLHDVPAFEAGGVVVRVPDWWKARRSNRVEVAVTVGRTTPSGLGLEALLDFSAAVSLDGEPLTDAEWRALREGTDGLVPLRGRWVEIDRGKLEAVLAHWKGVERSAAHGGISFLDGMRLLAGAPVARVADGKTVEPEEERAAWSQVVAGDWLSTMLDGMRRPEALEVIDAAAIEGALRATLRPYQRTGLQWLWLLHQLGLGACLADDMGLGKTIQVIALLLALRRQRADKREPPALHLLVVPASLIANWQSEIERFAPSLRTLVAHPSAMPARELGRIGAEALAGVDLVITTYGSVYRFTWVSEIEWTSVILDEAQAVKNPGAKQTRAVKALRARSRIALTGTPVENRLGDLWSLFDFLNPGLLGSARVFTRFTKRLEDGETRDYGPLRSLVRPYILRRLKSDRSIIADLPDKTELVAWCGLSRAQAALYQQSVEELEARLRTAGEPGEEPGMARRGLVLAYLLRLKQICNHPSQWLGDGNYAAADSGKLGRLGELCEPIAARQEKVLVFTQFREMTRPLHAYLEGVFARPGLVLDGETPIKERQRRVERFQSDEEVPFFVLSVKAGGTGLNLTAASHVIHFDRWWNPAVENQATDRAYRIGQRRNVLVHKFVCRGTVEERIDKMIQSKQQLSSELLAEGGEALLTEMNNEQLMQLVSLDINRALAET